MGVEVYTFLDSGQALKKIRCSDRLDWWPEMHNSRREPRDACITYENPSVSINARQGSHSTRVYLCKILTLRALPTPNRLVAGRFPPRLVINTGTSNTPFVRYPFLHSFFFLQGYLISQTKVIMLIRCPFCHSAILPLRKVRSLETGAGHQPVIRRASDKLSNSRQRGNLLLILLLPFQPLLFSLRS